VSTVELNFDDLGGLTELFGHHNRNLAAMQKAVGVTINSRGGRLSITGPRFDVDLAADMIRQLREVVRAGHPVYPPDVAYAVEILRKSPGTNIKDVFLDEIYVTGNKRVIAPKSLNQKGYIDAIRHHDIVFGIGPAGTGKTYLAVAMAVAALAKELVGTIILTRPAVEAGESLGFLPGDLIEKVNPYLRPLYDALYDMMDTDRANRLVERGAIEIAPLAFMRGRTLNDSFIILDEAQNTTSEQMKMFLTRLGFNSKTVITGDVTQIDLPPGRTSGLVEIQEVLAEVADIAFIRFSKRDVVRHKLVQSIIRAYERHESRSSGTKKEAEPEGQDR